MIWGYPYFGTPPFFIDETSISTAWPPGPADDCAGDALHSGESSVPAAGAGVEFFRPWGAKKGI